MSKESYLEFNQFAEKHILNKNVEDNAESKFQDKQFRNLEASRSRLNFALKRSIENLDDELIKFEKNFSNGGNKIIWARDYEDVFKSLEPILKNIPIVSIFQNSQTTIFKETGLEEFLKKKKIHTSVDGEVLFFNPQMMISETGSLLFTECDDQTIRKLNNFKVNVFFITIDKILGNLSQVENYIQFVKSYKSRSTSFSNVLFKASKNCISYLFIIDNQRTELLEQSEQRSIFTCLNCGICQEVCPVAKVAGEEAYANVFSGPVGSVVLPFLENIHEYQHAAFACTMCGRCEEVCPLQIPIRDMIVQNRNYILQKNALDDNGKKIFRRYKKFISNRKMMNWSKWIKQFLFGNSFSADYKRFFQVNQFDSSSYNKQRQLSQKNNNEDTFKL